MFSWFDIGNIKGYYSAIKSFSLNKIGFDFSKKDEYIYFINKKVIKYFSEASIVGNRLKRAKLLKNLTPNISQRFNYFCCVPNGKGNVLYDQKDLTIVSNLLKWLKGELWIPKKLSLNENIKFKKACKDFYYKKTINRLKNIIQDFNVMIVNLLLTIYKSSKSFRIIKILILKFLVKDSLQIFMVIFNLIIYFLRAMESLNY